MRVAKPVSVATGNRRLLRLARFLTTVQPESFTFLCFVAQWDRQHCGAICCGIGWMPRVDSKNWRWHSRGIVEYSVGLRRRPNNPFDDAGRYFAMSSDDVTKVFSDGPHRNPQTPVVPKELAAHIEKFVKSRKESAR